jgi:hypothetical protein
MPSINDMLDCCNPCNRLAMVAHFVPINTTYTESQLEELYDSRIVCFHEVTMRTVSDRETQFILKSWERLHEAMDTHLNFSSTYHPQTERVY